MIIKPENNNNKTENKELEVNGYIGGCWSDCHVYYENKSDKKGCGWDYVAYKSVFH